VNTRFVSPAEIRDIAPLLNTEGMLGGAFGPTDGLANPFLVVHAYATRAREMGAKILTHATVKGFETRDGKVAAVVSDQGTFHANWVINATGGYTAELAAMLGVEVPITPFRHQIIVTEPLDRCHNPMVIDLYHNVYFSQARHGAFLAGHSDLDEHSSYKLSERWDSCVQICRKLVKLMPRLKDINLVRQWAGLYEVTPDRQPILGPSAQWPNFWVAAGYSGHGFMLAPVSGMLLAEVIAHGAARTVDISPYSLERFKNQAVTIEANVV
jgi:sarcosine oxidase subunit beta